MYDLKIRGMGFDQARNVLLYTNHNYKDRAFMPTLHIWQHMSESKAFFARVREYFNGRPITRILEIGGHIGGHAALLSTLIEGDDGIVVVVEPEHFNVFQRRVVQSVIEPVKLIHFPMGSEDPYCYQMLCNFVSDYGKFQIIVADGRHNREGVTEDFENHYPMLATPGIFMIHDISVPHTGVVFDEITAGLVVEKIETYKEEVVKSFETAAANGTGLVFK